MLERLHAALLLAWGLLRALAARLVGARRGLAAFEASYAADRLLPVPEEERAALFRMGGCIACGLCDVGEGARRVRAAGAYAGVMDLMLASSRSMPDYDAAARSFRAVDDATLARLEGRCPAQVPMVAVARFVRRQGEAMAPPPDAGRSAPSR